MQILFFLGSLTASNIFNCYTFLYRRSLNSRIELLKQRSDRESKEEELERGLKGMCV